MRQTRTQLKLLAVLLVPSAFESILAVKETLVSEFKLDFCYLE